MLPTPQRAPVRSAQRRARRRGACCPAVNNGVYFRASPRLARFVPSS